MEKLLLFFLLFSCFMPFNNFAQTDKHSTFHLSFFPPLSTHGSQANLYTNGFSLNILGGISANEKHFTWAGLVNIICHNANGVQFAGLANYAGNNGHGMMFSGLCNIVDHRYSGFQFSGLFNVAQKTKGFQFGGLFNATTEIRGFQFGGLLNTAGEVRGAQFSGLFNIAGKVSGVQFAGLLNIADSCDYPIALINIIRKGEYSLALSYNDMGNILLTFRSGGRVTYGILGIGYNHKTHGNGFATEGGFGIHLNITKWLRINHELKGGTTHNFSDNPVWYTNYALMPAFRFSSHFEIFGGPSINYINSKDTESTKILSGRSLWKKYKNSNFQQIYIGYQIGWQYIF